MVSIRKRGKVYQYSFEIAKVDGKRRRKSKSGFKTKKEASINIENIIKSEVINEIIKIE